MILYEAAQTMLMCSAKWSWLKAWAMKVARHRGMIVSFSAWLAVIMHRIWVDGTEFRWAREVARSVDLAGARGRASRACVRLLRLPFWRPPVFCPLARIFR